MKRILTAIGSEELNNILRMQKDIEVQGTDIQYQEGIIEALEKYQDIDIIILKEDIIGELNLEELIRSIVILNNNIQIILIAEAIQEVERTKNIIKIVNDKNNYVDDIMKYLVDNVYINKKILTTWQEIKEDKENITREIEKEKIKIQKKKEIVKWFNNLKNSFKNLIMKKEKKKEIITVLGSSGIRKN